MGLYSVGLQLIFEMSVPNECLFLITGYSIINSSLSGGRKLESYADVNYFSSFEEPIF